MCKGLIVQAISVGTHRAKHGGIAKTAVSLRYQIERYRAMEPLFHARAAAMRLRRPSARRGQQFDIAEDLMRMTQIKDLSRPQCRLRVVERLRRLIWGQRCYHKRKWLVMHVAHHRLERTVEFCGRAILWILWVDIAVIVLKMLEQNLAGQIPPGLHWVDGALSFAGFVLVLATAFLPALMATLNAVLFQSTAEQLSQRHFAMFEALKPLYRRAGDIHDSIKRGNAPISINMDILDLSEKTAAAMAEEVAEWAALYLQSVKDA
jgi:hypothetical protein